MNTQNNGVVGLTLSIHIERSKLLCLCLDDVGFKCVGGLIMLVLVNREWVKLLTRKVHNDHLREDVVKKEEWNIQKILVNNVNNVNNGSWCCLAYFSCKLAFNFIQNNYHHFMCFVYPVLTLRHCFEFYYESNFRALIKL